MNDEKLFNSSGYPEDEYEKNFIKPLLLLTILGTLHKWEHHWLPFADFTELLGFSSNSSASDFSLVDNKAAALSMLTKNVDFVKDAHEEMEQVRGQLHDHR